MAYPQFTYPGYQLYYPQPVQDQLAQLRQQQIQPQMMQQPQIVQQPAPVMQPVDDRIWVQGESAATAYLVAANGFVRLWDSTAPVFYEKQADAQGKPLPMVVYDYKRRGDEPQAAPAPDHESRLEAIEKRLDAVEKKRTPKQQKEAEEA